MKYHQIDRNVFIKNRAKFMAQMKPNSVAVFNSNDIYPVWQTVTLPFAQHLLLKWGRSGRKHFIAISRCTL
jgi:Xaa-Pro aminopeptidase